MTNLEVAWIFREIADLLELSGENPFKVKAYRKAARILPKLEQDIKELISSNKLKEMPGIGKTLQANIEELLATGNLNLLQDLRQKVPAGLREMLAIPDIGVRSIRIIYEALGVTTLDELEKAAKDNQLRKLPGLGSKTELAVLRGIEMLRNKQGLIPLGIAFMVANEFIQSLSMLNSVVNLGITGPLRRGVEMVPEIILLAAVLKEEPEVIEIFARHPQVQEVLLRCNSLCRVSTRLGAEVELRLVPPERFWIENFLSTGSDEHLAGLNKIIGEKYGLTDLLLSTLSSKGFQVNSEEELYKWLSMQYIEPELRENRGEIQAALQNELPNLVTQSDIRGDLHTHTDWSDGVSSIEQMIESAKKMKYSFIAITDHSRSLSIANGLSLEKLVEQNRCISEISARMENLTILRGVEVDILGDGSLDYPDEVLAEMDIVVASIHTGFKMEREKMTARLERAVKNPHVDILAHPTGRMLGRRRAYEADMEKIIELACKTGTWLEINASPDRLDLNDFWARQAKDMGVPISINTDAHDASRLKDMTYGVLTARRSWLQAKDVVNTWPVERILEETKRKK
ncbi:MAG: DNA polymerase/3'-5' exonuclease PolX [Bacillota bacterium]